jgi:hypothetical protein
MMDLLQQWLDARLSVPGMIACGLTAAHAPDSAGICRSADANFPTDYMAEILRMLLTNPDVPGAAPTAIRWHTWIFANGKIRAVMRPDGWIFAAAVRANSDAAQILDPLSEEFLALRSADAAPAPTPDDATVPA